MCGVQEREQGTAFQYGLSLQKHVGAEYSMVIGQNIGGMIFAAGVGSRFKPWTDQHPKALAVINGKSLLQRNVEYLQEYGITDVVVNVHHFAEQVIEAIEKNKGWGSS